MLLTSSNFFGVENLMSYRPEKSVLKAEVSVSRGIRKKERGINNFLIRRKCRALFDEIVLDRQC